MKRSENGSALVYILIAIALMAALAYNITSNSRSGSSMLTEEQAALAATEIIAYGNVVEQAVQKLKLRGCSDTEISFENPFTTDDYSNSNAPADNSCHVFDTSGGNINYLEPQNIWLDDLAAPGFYGENVFALTCVPDLGTHGASCNTASNTLLHGDLTLFILWLKEDVCRAINERLYGDDSIPTDTNAAFHSGALFTGDYNVTTAHINYASGEVSGCFTGNGGGTYVGLNEYGYYKVLIAR